MATVTSIAAAIASQLSALSFVDKASATEYTPALASVTCVAFVIPFDQETSAEVRNLDGDIALRHVLTVEFWTQIKNNRVSDAMTTARDAGALAIAALVTNDGTGYTLASDIGFRERIYSEPVMHAGVPWIITALRVPVDNEVSI